jgi:hypothetical protein
VLKPTLLAATLILMHALIQMLEHRYLKKIEFYLARMDGFMDE